MDKKLLHVVPSHENYQILKRNAELEAEVERLKLEVGRQAAEADRLLRALKISEAERERLMDLHWPPTVDRTRGLAGVVVEKWREKPYRRYSFDQAIDALAAALPENADG